MIPEVARGASVWSATQSGSAVETIAQDSVEHAADRGERDVRAVAERGERLSVVLGRRGRHAREPRGREP